jgi:hypothetical protein
MSDVAVAKITDAPSAISVNRTEYQVLREQAADLIASGYLPNAIDKPEKAVAIIMLGRELGMRPWQSFNSIDVIQGRPTLKPIGMAALVNRFVEARGGYLRVVESSGERCTVEYLRPPAPAPRRVSFTLAEAEAAELLGKETWRKYPRDMLRSRAISRACREGFSDVILGVYTDEEVEAIGPPGALRALRSATTPTDDDDVRVPPGRSGDAARPADGEGTGHRTGHPLDAVPGAVSRGVPAERGADPRRTANNRYHAIGASHGWSDAALHLLAVALVPERPDGPTTSRNQLTTRELHDLADLMAEDIGRRVDAESGEATATPEVEYANAIAAAVDQRQLDAIADRIRDGAIAAPWLRKMGARRRIDLAADAPGIAGTGGQASRPVSTVSGRPIDDDTVAGTAIPADEDAIGEARYGRTS